MTAEGDGEPLGARETARVLSEIGTLIEMNGGDSFRARAFTSAARALEGSDADLHALALEDRLTTLPGIGAGIGAVVREIVLTGRSGIHDELRAATPIGLFELLRVPGLGPKRIHTLHQKLGIESLDALEAAALEGRVAALPGFGPKTEQKVLAGLTFARSSRGRRRYPEALEVAVRLLEWLRAHPSVAAAEIVGPLRRRLEVVDRIDLVAAAGAPRTVLTAFTQLHGVTRVAEESEDSAEVRLTDGMAARLRCVSTGGFVPAVVWETGSDAHTADLAAAAQEAGLRFDEGGLRKGDSRLRVADEEKLYERLGLAYVPPELREGLGEVDAAREHRVPRLVELADLQGTFHCHTTYSDGKATLEEMAGAAREQGWRYLGIADHSRSASYAGGLPPEKVLAQQEAIDALNAEQPDLRLFKGIESDILADGALDYPDEVLASFDYVVGSVHSGFRMPEGEMTERMITAVRNPYLTILGHPTGRLLLSREGYTIDVRAVIAAAAESGVVIEINSNPHRLDLDWRYVRQAAAAGVLIAINPDAHSQRALEHVAFGVNMARKAGLEARQILNCWTLDEVETYFAARKQRR